MELIEKIKSKDAQIGIIGLGYVGLPIVIEFCKEGFKVTGFDIDSEKIELLKQGKSYIKHVSSLLLTLLIAGYSRLQRISAVCQTWTAL